LHGPLLPFWGKAHSPVPSDRGESSSFVPRGKKEFFYFWFLVFSPPSQESLHLTIFPLDRVPPTALPPMAFFFFPASFRAKFVSLVTSPIGGRLICSRIHEFLLLVSFFYLRQRSCPKFQPSLPFDFASGLPPSVMFFFCCAIFL